MFSSPNSSPRLAKAPFDDSRADAILRSSDGVDFRVFQIILSLISPVFVDKFNTARSSFPTYQDILNRAPGAGLPMAHLDEDSGTLDLALRHCYPTRSPELSSLRDAQVLLEFAQKYKVDALGPSLAHFLVGAITDDPVGIYALASKYQYEDVSSAAARACLNLPLSRLTSPELLSVIMDKYQQLIRYYSSCGEAAVAVTLQREWFTSSHDPIFCPSEDSTCCKTRDNAQDRPVSDPKSSTSRSPPRYLGRYMWSYLHRSALVLAYHPSVEAVTAEDFVLKDIDCPACMRFRRREMLEFSRDFGAEIKKAIEQVSRYSADIRWHCIDRGWLFLCGRFLSPKPGAEVRP